jgi:multisubunit Na+/H+ antiporter MnhF subunit
VNPWLLAATVLLLGLVACMLVAARGGRLDALVAAQMAAVVVAMAILLMAVGFDRALYADAAVLIALLSFAGGMAFVRFLQRWG